MAWQPHFYGEGHSFERVLIDEGIKRGCRWEAFSPVPYKDKHKDGFKWAICYGHVFGGQNDPIVIDPETLEFEYKGQKRRELTPEEGMEIFLADMESKMRFLRKKVLVKTTTCMWNALGLLVLNTGEGNFMEGPVLPLLNKEFYVGASAAFMYHNKSWRDVKDENGVVVLGEDGKPLRALQIDNGLTVRRATEIDLFSTRIDK